MEQLKTDALVKKFQDDRLRALEAQVAAMEESVGPSFDILTLAES